MLLEKVIAFSVLKPANSSSQLAGSQPTSAARKTVRGRMGACVLALPNRSATMAGSPSHQPAGGRSPAAADRMILERLAGRMPRVPGVS